jgi:hypothetical protein
LSGNATIISSLLSSNTTTNSLLSGNATLISSLQSSNTTTNSLLSGNATIISSLLSSNTTTNSRIDGLNTTMLALNTSNTTTNARIDSLNTTMNAMDVSYYGGIYNSTAGQTLTLTAANTWYNLTNWVSGLQNGFNTTAGGIGVTCNKSGTYVITYSITSTINANQEVQFQILKNNVAEPKSYSRNTFTTNNYQQISYSFFEALVVGDNITMQVRNPGSAGKVLTTDNRNLVIFKVGG